MQNVSSRPLNKYPLAKRSAMTALVLLLTAFCIQQSRGLTILDHYGGKGPGGRLGSLGYTLTEIGQTFTVAGPDTSLIRMRFAVTDQINWSEPLTYAAYVMEWDGHRATGGLLFESDPIIQQDQRGRELDIAVPHIQLEAGKSYVAFLSTFRYPRSSGPYPYEDVVQYFYDSYTDGSLVFKSASTKLEDLTNRDWSSFPNQDLMFLLAFDRPAAVPENGSTLALAVVAIGGISTVSLVRRNRSGRPRQLS